LRRGKIIPKFSNSFLKLFPKYLGFERAMLNHLVTDESDFVGAINVLPKNLSMMFVHAYQSYVFNRILSQRIEKGILASKPLIGDLILPADSQGLPDHKKWIEVAEHNIEKITKKVGEKKAFISGLIPGAEVEVAKGESGEIEIEILREEGFVPRDYIIPEIRGLSSKGMRRELISQESDFDYEVGQEEIEVKFKLQKGCYATALLREYMKADILSY
jgi:tRNA pseudouridine13 synthase